MPARIIVIAVLYINPHTAFVSPDIFRDSRLVLEYRHLPYLRHCKKRLDRRVYFYLTVEAFFIYCVKIFLFFK